jgi:plastocyanin
MQTNIRSTLIATVLGVALATATANTSPGHADDAPHFVTIDNFTFNPQRLTVTAGSTVTWTNKDDIPHAIASSNALFRSGAFDTDGNYSFTFTTPGTYQYFCYLHPHMTGTIVVEAAAGGDTAR